MRAQEAESKTRMLSSVWNVLDFVAFFPPLLELALMYGANLPFRLGRFDLRWFKILRWGIAFPCLMQHKDLLEGNKPIIKNEQS